eukprot:SAG31_NODE_35_length_31836_cov_10.841352_25_plen_244_part_00
MRGEETESAPPMASPSEPAPSRRRSSRGQPASGSATNTQATDRGASPPGSSPDSISGASDGGLSEEDEQSRISPQTGPTKSVTTVQAVASVSENEVNAVGDWIGESLSCAAGHRDGGLTDILVGKSGNGGSNFIKCFWPHPQSPSKSALSWSCSSTIRTASLLRVSLSHVNMSCSGSSRSRNFGGPATPSARILASMLLTKPVRLPCRHLTRNEPKLRVVSPTCFGHNQNTLLARRYMYQAPR